MHICTGVGTCDGGVEMFQPRVSGCQVSVLQNECRVQYVHVLIKLYFVHNRINYIHIAVSICYIQNRTLTHVLCRYCCMNVKLACTSLNCFQAKMGRRIVHWSHTPGHMVATLVVYSVNFPDSAGSSYSRVAVK